MDEGVGDDGHGLPLGSAAHPLDHRWRNDRLEEERQPVLVAAAFQAIPPASSITAARSSTSRWTSLGAVFVLAPRLRRSSVTTVKSDRSSGTSPPNADNPLLVARGLDQHQCRASAGAGHRDACAVGGLHRGLPSLFVVFGVPDGDGFVP